MRTDNPWKINSSKIVYENRWMRIHEDQVIMPSGKPGLYAYLESKDSVVIIALDDKQRMYLMRSFSYPTGVWSWRVPQGSGEGEDPLAAAQRELHEETGIIAKQWTRLGQFRVCNGFMTECSSVYVARGITQNGETDDDEPADAIKWTTLPEADAMIERSDIDDSQSIVAIHLVQKWLDRQEQ